MNRQKKHLVTLITLLLTVLLAVLCVTAPAIVSEPDRAIAAAGNVSVRNAGSGELTSKEEVIYARLSGDGTVLNIYAINILNVEREGLVSDYGSYEALKNLSSTATPDYRGDTMTVEAKPGRFYYQGNLDSKELPWKVSIGYSLDGSAILPTELPGKTGLLELRIKTSANEAINPAFYENYLLQITVTLDTTKCTDISAEGAVFANSGSNKLITFSVMPKRTADLLITTRVKDFSMDGIQLSAVPFTMNIDMPDTASLTADTTKLIDAIALLGDSVGSLEAGMKELSSGTTGLQDGSAEFLRGIHKLDASSAELVSGSKSISDALNTIASSLQSSLQSNDMTALLQLPDALSQLSAGLKGISEGMTALSSGYGSAYSALDTAIKSIPAEDIPTEDLQSLALKNPFNQTLNQLLDYYKAAQTVKYTYARTEPAFTAMNEKLSEMAASLDTISSSLDTVALQLASSTTGSDLTSSIAKLVMGINALSTNYKGFHNGLKEYTAGVSALSANYAKLDKGVGELEDGAKEMADGVGKLNTGAEELVAQTKDIPSRMDETIDSLLSDYDTSNFAPVSFVSEKNEHVSAVQFVLKTAAIEPRKEQGPVSPPERKDTVLTRLLNLF